VAGEAYGDRDAIEVIIADNMSTDGTAPIASRHGVTELTDRYRYTPKR
jgi:glycosyltransferase involved in cell wall biosynthesis